MRDHASTELRRGLWSLGLVAAAVSLGWALTLGGRAAPIAEGGSPLYETALQESRRVLAGQVEDSPAAVQVCPTCGKVHPPVPVGEAEDSDRAHYFCTKCQTYHHSESPVPLLPPQQR